MPDEIINIVLLETVEDQTFFGGQTSISIQENNKGTAALIKHAAEELVIANVENACQSAMFQGDSALKLIEQLMQSVSNTDWMGGNHCFVHTNPAAVEFSVEGVAEESVVISTSFGFIVEKLKILTQKPETARTIEGMTRSLDGAK